MKMKAILAATLQLLLMLHTANYGSGQGQEIPACGPETTTANNQICNELFEALQASITSETNLYNLRKIFFPSSKEPPTLLNVKYKLNTETEVETPCFNSGDTINSSEVWSKNYGWTSNTIFTLFHPATLNRMQPYPFYWMMARLEPSTSGTTEAALLWNGDTDFLTLDLVLNVKQLSCLPTNQQIDQTLQDITSVLKVYARDQKNLTEWESQDSHVLDGRVFDKDWQKYECEIYSALWSCHIFKISNAVAVLLTIIAIMVILALIKIKGPKKGISAMNRLAAAEEGNATGGTEDDVTYDFFHSLMWSAGGILVWGIVFVLCDIVGVFSWGLVMEGFLLLLQLTAVIIFSIFSYKLLNHKENKNQQEGASQTQQNEQERTSQIEQNQGTSQTEILTPVPILKPSRAFFTAMCCGLPLEYIFCVMYRSTFKCLKKRFERYEGYENTIDKWLKSLRKSNKAKLLAGTFPLGSLFLVAGILSRSLVPITLYFLIYQRRVLVFYPYVATVFVCVIMVTTHFDYIRRCKKRELTKDVKKKQKERPAVKKEGKEDTDFVKEVKDITEEVSREAHYCFHESYNWLEHHYPLFLPLFTFLFLFLTFMLFVLIYHTIVAQGQAGNALFHIFSALFPAALVSVYSGNIGRILRKRYKLDKKKTAQTGELNPENATQ